MCLDVRVFCAEQRLGAFDREHLDLVDDLAALVVAPPRITLRILVGENRAGYLHRGHRHEVLRRYQLDVVALPRDLEFDEPGQVGVDFCQHAAIDHRASGGWAVGARE